MTAVWRYVGSERQFFGPAFAGYAIFAMLLYGFYGWLPTYLIRAFHETPQDVGRVLGPLVFANGLVAPPLFGWLADRLYARRGPIASVRLVGLLFLLIALSGVSILAVRTLGMALFAGIAVGFMTAGVGTLAPIAVQTVAPARMRGQLASVQLLCSNLIGMSLGPVIVSALSTYVFKADGLGSALGWHVAVLATMGMAISFLVRPLTERDDAPKRFESARAVDALRLDPSPECP